MGNNRLYLKSGFWYAVATFMNCAVAILSTPIFTRIMSIEEYGVVNLYNTWLTLLTIVITINGASCIQIVKIHHEDDHESYVNTVLILSTATSIVLFGLIFCVNQCTHFIGLDNSMLLIMFVEIITKNVFNIWIAYRRVYLDYKNFTVVSIAAAIISSISSIVFIILLGIGAYGKVIGHMIPYVIIGSILFFRLLSKTNALFKRCYLKEILDYCLPLIPHSLSGFLLSSFDRIIINSLVDTSSVAIYSLSYSYCSLLSYLITALNGGWVVWLFDKIKEQSINEIRNGTRVLTLFIMMVVIVMIGLGPEAIIIFGSKKYIDGIAVIPPIVLGIYMNFLYVFYVNVEFYHKKTKSIAIGTMGSAAINVMLNYIFISKFGYIAAAYTTLFSYFLLYIFHYFISKRVDDMDYYGDKFLITSLGITFLSGALLFPLYNMRLQRYCMIAVIVLTLAMIINIFYKNEFSALINLIKKKGNI